MRFDTGNIAEYNYQNSPDIVITLHACDVATDFALDYAIKNNCSAILSVPCCQHEINNQLNLMGDYVTPQMHGAKGDGVTNDTDAFNEMLAELNGGTILIPNGTYIISKLVLDNVTLVGESLNAILKQDDTIDNFLYLKDIWNMYQSKYHC